jgi:hypothetical protein
MLKIDLKAVTSAFASLAVTFVMCWTFLDATRLVHLPADGGASFLSAISVLVR